MVKQYITWTEIQKIPRKTAVVMKACPFCGALPEFRCVGYNSQQWGLRCKGCKVITPVKGGLDGKKRAADFWNSRVKE